LDGFRAAFFIVLVGQSSLLSFGWAKAAEKIVVIYSEPHAGVKLNNEKWFFSLQKGMVYLADINRNPIDV
jgi:hypothetical protein